MSTRTRLEQRIERMEAVTAPPEPEDAPPEQPDPPADPQERAWWTLSRLWGVAADNYGYWPATDKRFTGAIERWNAGNVTEAERAEVAEMEEGFRLYTGEVAGPGFDDAFEAWCKQMATPPDEEPQMPEDAPAPPREDPAAFGLAAAWLSSRISRAGFASGSTDYDNPASAIAHTSTYWLTLAYALAKYRNQAAEDAPRPEDGSRPGLAEWKKYGFPDPRQYGSRWRTDAPEKSSNAMAEGHNQASASSN